MKPILVFLNVVLNFFLGFIAMDKQSRFNRREKKDDLTLKRLMRARCLSNALWHAKELESRPGRSKDLEWRLRDWINFVALANFDSPTAIMTGWSSDFTLPEVLFRLNKGGSNELKDLVWAITHERELDCKKVLIERLRELFRQRIDPEGPNRFDWNTFFEGFGMSCRVVQTKTRV